MELSNLLLNSQGGGAGIVQSLSVQDIASLNSTYTDLIGCKSTLTALDTNQFIFADNDPDTADDGKILVTRKTQTVTKTFEEVSKTTTQVVTLDDAIPGSTVTLTWCYRVDVTGGMAARTPAAEINIINGTFNSYSATTGSNSANPSKAYLTLNSDTSLYINKKYLMGNLGVRAYFTASFIIDTEITNVAPTVTAIVYYTSQYLYDLMCTYTIYTD